jgi:hypothetical protein
MPELVDPAPLPPEVEALLWSARVEELTVQAPLSDVRYSAEQCDAIEAAAATFVQRQVDRAELLEEWEHAVEQVARWQGIQTRLLADALDLALVEGTSGSDADMSVRDMAAELGCAAAMPDRTVQRRMSDAGALRDRLPATYGALLRGRLSLAHAQVVLDEGTRLAGSDARAEYEQIVLERSPSLSVGRLRAMAKSVAEHLDPVSIQERHAAARDRRCASVRDGDDSMGELLLVAPSVLIHGIHDRATTIARGVLDADGSDTRTLDQARADVMCDLLLTGHATSAEADAHGGEGLDAIRAIVQITVPVLTLMGESDAAPTLDGRQPIDPHTARTLAGSATLWDRVLTDPIDGSVLAVDRRFPTEAQRRHLRARDEHCRFPGCRAAVWRCDVDHTVDAAHGGETCEHNLAHLCRRHHSLKHHTAWKVVQLSGGVLVWTSPEGRTYTDRPPPTLRFVTQQ